MLPQLATKPDTAHASRPFFETKPAQSPFFPGNAVQAKLEIGTPGDRFEREADAVADGVVQRMAAPSIQAKCNQCEREETVRRQAQTGSAPDTSTRAADSLQQGLTEQQGAGRSLDVPLRREMENALSADFSNVRIHTGASAASLNKMVQARAFTHGQDVFFNTGQFEPDTRGGRHLLAHELTHVVQQSGGTPRIQRDDDGGGSTVFNDTVTSTSRSADSPVISGTVKRTETAPAVGSKPAEEVSSGNMNIEFDPSTCSVTIPFGYNFVQALSGVGTDVCDTGPAASLLSTEVFNALKAKVLRTVNAGLNGWFDVELTGKGCPGKCAGRRMPIRVVAAESNAPSATTLTVVNLGGRANAGTICARSWNDDTAEHEGGHQVLGLGDEYPEKNEALRKVVPKWFRPERVRRDYSKMGPEQDSRFAMFHPRHFAAVTAFLSHIFPGCTATLIARARPIIPDFRINLGGGFASVSGMPGYFFRTGIDIGIPLDRMRRWEFTLGPEFNMLVAQGDQRFQNAFLLGARIGLEGSTGDAGFGVTGGPFLSAGYGWFHSSDRRTAGVGSRDAEGAYGEIGGRFGIRSGLDGVRLNLGLEAAAGTALGAPGIVGRVGPEILSDPARTHWLRFGLGAALQF